MTKFYFEAANQDGNKVSGHLDASNAEEAQKALKAQKFAIFSITQSLHHFSFFNLSFTTLNFSSSIGNSPYQT